MAEREQIFMEAQADISRKRLQAKTGCTLQVLVDTSNEQGAIARSAADAPEIDGLVYVMDGQHLRAGDMIEVLIDHADQHDLHGRLSH